jgi:hypothetical protein
VSSSTLPDIPEVVPAGTVNLLAPESPGAAFDAFLATHAATLRDRPAWQEGDAPMPRCTSATGRRRCSTTRAGSRSSPTGRRTCPSHARS